MARELEAQRGERQEHEALSPSRLDVSAPGPDALGKSEGTTASGGGCRKGAKPRWNHTAVLAAAQIFVAAIISAAIVASKVGVKYLLQPSCTVWIFITAMVVLSSTSDCLGQGVLKAVDRAGATLLGGIMGIGLNAVGVFLEMLGPPWLERTYTVIGVASASALVSFLWLSYAMKVKWLSGHSYVYILGVVTMGFVWLDAANSHDMLNEGISRIAAIFIGDVIALFALVMFHPGSAISVVHGELVQCSRVASELVVQVSNAGIEKPELPMVADHIFVAKSPDPLHQRYLSLLSKWHSLRQLLTYKAWEPSWLQPRSMAWAPPGAEKQYLLLVWRLTRLVITAMSIDTQLRAMRFCPDWDEAMTDAIRKLASSVRDLLLETSDRLELAVRNHALPGPSTRMRELIDQVGVDIEDLDQTAWGQDDAGSPANRASEAANAGGSPQARRTSSGPRPNLLRGASLLRISCSPGVEAAYVQRAGTAFIFLATQMGVQAVRFVEDAERLLEGRLSEPGPEAPQMDISREATGAPEDYA